MAKESATHIADPAGHAVPLVVAVTGHRDLVDAEVPGLRTLVRDFLQKMISEHPDCGVSVMSSLAEGTDQLVAEEALSLGVPVIVPLPMPKNLYIEDFASAEAKQKFQELLAAAAKVFELPIVEGSTPESIVTDSNDRDRQYAQLGVFLCAHCHILLALWDGKYTEMFGGTGDVVRFHHDDVMPGVVAGTATSRLVLTDDESDLVYHIACSRDRPGGGPIGGLQPLDAAWFTTHETEARSREMPTRYRVVFERMSEFCRDVRQFGQRIAAGGFSLISSEGAEAIPQSVRDIEQTFRAADWLAIHFQRRHLRALQATHALALLMGLMYIAYSDMSPARAFIITFIVLFLIGAGIHWCGRKLAWHRKYLDYRALAEGLRVQFYWAVAGVTQNETTKFSHDNFLQMQDAELGWIRHVMRVAGLESNVMPNRDGAGLEYSIREWIGDDSGGQLGYYQKKATERIRRNKLTQLLAGMVVWFSIVAFGLFAVAGADLAGLVRDEIIILMGVLLLAAGVRQSYGFAVADFELIKQYEFMCRTFGKARRRIISSENDEARRHILRLVGDASLEEHAEWLLMHRERSVSEGELWRLTS